MSEEKFKDLPTGLYWKGKKTKKGKGTFGMNISVTGRLGISGRMIDIVLLLKYCEGKLKLERSG